MSELSKSVEQWESMSVKELEEEHRLLMDFYEEKCMEVIDSYIMEQAELIENTEGWDDAVDTFHDLATVGSIISDKQ